jgi:LysR substrate binding domain
MTVARLADRWRGVPPAPGTITPTTAGVHALAQARQVLAAAHNLVAEATTGHARLRIGHAWSAMGQHTREFQRRWAARYPDVELHLIRTNSATGGLAEGLCDIAVLRTAVGSNRFASAIVGHERRYCALAADDPWARRRSIRLDEIPQRTLLIDRRTGTTSPGLWPAARQPHILQTRDIDDWLTIIHACRNRPADRPVPPPVVTRRSPSPPAFDKAPSTAQSWQPDLASSGTRRSQPPYRPRHESRRLYRQIDQRTEPAILSAFTLAPRPDTLSDRPTCARRPRTRSVVSTGLRPPRVAAMHACGYWAACL